MAVYKTFMGDGAEVLATDYELSESWLSPLDVSDYQQLEKTFKLFRPALVLHLAALTDVEYCENNPEAAWKINALGTENVALLSKEFGATMVYISTGAVFDGTKEFYTDFDIPNPISGYGKSKYYGEVVVREMVDKYFIFRAGWMMGGGPKKDIKFLGKIYKKIKAGGKELSVVDDKFGNPTYTYNFAEAMLKVIKTDLYGLYNQAGLNPCSRYELAVEFVKLLGLEKEVKINNIKSETIKTEFSASRPAWEVLKNLKLEIRGINYMRDWKDCLAEYVGEFKEDLWWGRR